MNVELRVSLAQCATLKHTLIWNAVQFIQINWVYKFYKYRWKVNFQNYITCWKDKGNEWHARKTLAGFLTGGEGLIEQTERWDREDWLRGTLGFVNFPTLPTALDSLIELMIGFWGNTSLLDWSLALCSGVSKREFNLSSVVDRDKEDICWLNAFR